MAERNRAPLGRSDSNLINIFHPETTLPPEGDEASRPEQQESQPGQQEPQPEQQPEPEPEPNRSRASWAHLRRRVGHSLDDLVAAANGDEREAWERHLQPAKSELKGKSPISTGPPLSILHPIPHPSLSFLRARLTLLRLSRRAFPLTRPRLVTRSAVCAYPGSFLRPARRSCGPQGGASGKGTAAGEGKCQN